jgi:hypothetical protein
MPNGSPRDDLGSMRRVPGRSYRRPMPTIRQSLAGAVAGCTAALLLAAPAHAAPAEHATVTGADGREVLHLRPTAAGDAVLVDLEEGGETIVASGGCVRDAPARLTCTVGPNGLTLNLGGGDDRVDVDPEAQLEFHVVADGGPGNDRLTGAFGIETLIGGDGDDLLDGRGGADRLDGGAGVDQLDGGAGADALFGGDGDDHLVGDGLLAPVADLLDGGAGRDTVEDWSPSGAGARGPVAIGVDDGPGDGFAGEHDELRAVEVLRVASPGTIAGSAAADEIAVVNGPTTVDGRDGDDVLWGGVDADALNGGAGADRIAGGPGGDTLTGGPGRDAISGDGQQSAGFGSDTIEARDGEVDTVDCGPGSDRVVADSDDVVAGDCETVERPDGGGPGTRQGEGPGRGGGRGRGGGGSERLVVRPAAGRAVRLATALRRGLPLRVDGPAGRLRLRATVPAAVARRAGLKPPRGARRGAPVVVATATATLRGIVASPVRLSFTRAARSRLRRLRAVTLTVSARGVAGGGKVTLRR